MSKTNALTKPEATQGGTSTSGVRTYSMTAHHMLSMSNTLYMYKVDLVWVWSGWEDLIITQQYMHFKILTPLLLLLLSPEPTLFRVMVWYGVASLRPPTAYKGCQHLLYVWSGSGMSMKWMGGPNHILQHVPSEKPRQNPMTQPTPFGVMVWYGVVALWLPTMVEGF